MTFSSDQLFSLSAGVIATEIDGESVLLHSTSGQYFGLNDTGTHILQLIKKQQSYSSICEKMRLKHPENSSDINADVNQLLSDMLSKQLIKQL